MTDTDRLAAHLDRGWELLERGDALGASNAADKAEKAAPGAPETHTLRGAIAAQLGDPEQAAEHFRAAMKADPEYPAPILQSAELALYSLDDPAEGLKLAQRAAEVAEDDADLADAVLLIADAQLTLERPADAAGTMAELDGISVEDPSVHVRAGQLWLDMNDARRACAHFRKAVDLDPELADAHHGIGLACEALGDHRTMQQAFLETRRLDLVQPHAPWHMSEAEFQAIADHAMEALPPQARELLVNVPILIADYPAAEIVAEGYDPRMLGFFSGVPYPEKMNVGGGAPQPDCVFLYQRNIESHCADRDELEREIAITLWHETAHFFGLDDDDLDEIGLG